MRRLLALAVAAAAATAPGAVQAFRPAVHEVPQAIRPAVNAPRVTVVRVDVSASDARGRRVENLEPTDFDVSENGVAQSLDTVRFIKADDAGANEPAPIRSAFDEQEQAGREGTRLFALFLDEYHVRPGAGAARAREALTAFVDRELGPHDLVAVMKPLDSLLTIRLTNDRDLVRRAIATFEGRRGEYQPRNGFEKNFIAGAPARIEQVRTQVATSALNALVVHLGTLNDGRKTVLFVTEGLTRATRRRGFETLPTVDTVLRSANRYNVAIYPIDPQPPREADQSNAPAAAPAGTDTLRALAEGTDGRAIAAAGSLEAALKQIAHDAAAYYLLTYRSTHPDDGKFRAVEVRVKRPGVRVRARKGYWALWPDEAFVSDLLARGSTPPPAAPPGFDAPRRISPLIRPWLGLSRGDAGNTRVTFVWEPVSRVPGDRTRMGTPSRVVLRALAADGTHLFDGPVRAAPASLLDRDDDAPARAVFDAPPGRLRLLMSIEDATALEIDSDVRDVAIRDLKGGVVLGTAEILRTRNARERRAVAADPDAVPAASREFRRTDHLVVRVQAYAPDGRPRVSVRLQSRMGQVMRDLTVESPSVLNGRFQSDMPLAGLAPGEYYLEITAASDAGEAKDLIGFRVTS